MPKPLVVEYRVSITFDDSIGPVVSPSLGDEVLSLLKKHFIFVDLIEMPDSVKVNDSVTLYYAGPTNSGTLRFVVSASADPFGVKELAKLN